MIFFCFALPNAEPVQKSNTIFHNNNFISLSQPEVLYDIVRRGVLSVEGVAQGDV